jgi:hypothetical protein
MQVVEMRVHDVCLKEVGGRSVLVAVEGDEEEGQGEVGKVAEGKEGEEGGGGLVDKGEGTGLQVEDRQMLRSQKHEFIIIRFDFLD